MFRTAIARQARLFTTTARQQKSPIETVKDAAKVVDRKVSDAAIKGIETGEKATEAVKQSVPASTGQAKGEAKEAYGQAKGKANELAGEAKGKANEVTGEAKGKANELSGEANAKTKTY